MKSVDNSRVVDCGIKGSGLCGSRESERGVLRVNAQLPCAAQPQ
jgi:hypothetical protein